MLHQQPVPLSYKWSFDSTIPFANEWDASAQDDTRDMNQVSDFRYYPRRNTPGQVSFIVS
jgi:hypothetical protein